MLTWVLSLLGSPIFKTIGTWILHSLKRFWSVFAIGIIVWILWGQITSYQIIKKVELKRIETMQYNLGFNTGYKQAGIDHPTYGNVGSVTNIVSGYDPLIHFSAGSLEFGFFWRK